MTEVEGIHPIGDLVHGICDRLGLDPKRVARLEIFPGALEATMDVTVYRTKVSLIKGHPRPYIYPAPGGGEGAAQQVFTFRVTTHP